QRGTPAVRVRDADAAGLSAIRAFRLGDFRELGKRVPADGHVRAAHRVAAPARAGGVARLLYANSLALAFFALFLASFALHALGSWRHGNEERLMHGQLPQALGEHLAGAQFWFESFQNWQSEFLAVLAIVVLSIWLRQDKSPESKPVDAPHRQTGT